MLHNHALALDLARERARDLEREAARRRLLAQARMTAPSTRPGGVRAVIARPIRAFSDASHAVSHAACAAASRLEGGATRLGCLKGEAVTAAALSASPGR